MRHEVIALQNAASAGGAEHYPACFQLNVSGGASTSASDFLSSLGAQALASFPGAYSATDPGLLLNAYNGGLDYSSLFPGPPIPSVLSNGGDSASTPTSAMPSAASVTPPASSVVPQNTSTHTLESHTMTKTYSHHPSHTGHPHVMVTTVTKVFVLTVTLDDGAPAIHTTVGQTSTETQPPVTTYTTSRMVKKSMLRHNRRSI